jgi:hypothetical protein
MSGNCAVTPSRGARRVLVVGDAVDLRRRGRVVQVGVGADECAGVQVDAEVLALVVDHPGLVGLRVDVETVIGRVRQGLAERGRTDLGGLPGVRVDDVQTTLIGPVGVEDAEAVQLAVGGAGVDATEDFARLQPGDEHRAGDGAGRGAVEAQDDVVGGQAVQGGGHGPVFEPFQARPTAAPPRW